MSRGNIVFAIAPLFFPLLVAVPAGKADAATINVSNCNDSGSGSLRDVVGNAASGDTIDMSSLPCRLINLTSGAITIPQRHLSLIGGPPGLMKIDAGRRSQVFVHSGAGWLRIKRMNIADGFYSAQSPTGGCLYSAGNIELLNSSVHGCRAVVSAPGYGRGGGIFAWGTVRLVYTSVTGNTVVGLGLGGGVVASDGLRVNHSSISNNRSQSRSAVYAPQGFSAQYSTFSNNHGATTIGADGAMLIANSTVSGNVNTAKEAGWATVGLGGLHNGGSVSIIDSTISGNTQTPGSEILALNVSGPKSIVNSTIAFNRNTGGCGASGRSTVYLGSGSTLLDSTVISNNACADGPQPSVFGTGGSSPAVLVGSDNLVTTSGNIPLPPDTISADPKLAALADNGGPTRTHALAADSPAIDSGNNEAGLDYDERGPGFPRVKGARADIGAFER
jgi:hypothetical protein